MAYQCRSGHVGSNACLPVTSDQYAAVFMHGHGILLSMHASCMHRPLPLFPLPSLPGLTSQGNRVHFV